MKFQDSEYHKLSLPIRRSKKYMYSFALDFSMNFIQFLNYFQGLQKRYSNVFFKFHHCLKIIYVTTIYCVLFSNSLDIKEIRNNTKPLQYITIFFLLYLREV